MNYRFYTKTSKSGGKKIQFPCFFLLETSWEDENFKSQFKLLYYEHSRRKTEIGFVKILQKGKRTTNLPSKFSKLPKSYCSLGQSNSFYSTLYRLFSKEQITIVLNALNDITQSRIAAKIFKDEPGFRTSLLRTSEAQKAFNEVPFLLIGQKAKNSFHFEFATQIPSFSVPHSAFFSFNKRSKLPKRIGAIIGKNGSGKTQYLARLASSLSGTSDRGIFSDKKLPPFSRVIAVSYSLFDRFEKPNQTKSFSYYFCGFQSEKEFQSLFSLERRLNKALKTIREAEKINELRMYLDYLLGHELASNYIENIESKRNHEYGFFFTENFYTKLSSGQIMMMVVTTEIVAYIRDQSILLFDEPETHLHPNAISRLIAVIYEILKRHDSYAIIATHSPQIIQEIPSSLIYYFDQDKENPPVRELPFETFGENLTTLTEKIFGTLDVDEYYKKVLKDLYRKYTKKEILGYFDDDKFPLSMNAKIFIEHLSKSNEKPKGPKKA